LIFKEKGKVLIERDEEIKEILENIKSVAVVGLSANPDKPGNYVPKFLKERGIRVFGVNPKYEGQQIMGIKVFKSLSEIPEDIDVILVFRPPEDVPQILKEALQKGFKVFWMQPGTVNEEIKKQLILLGRKVVAGRCIKIETQRLGISPP
jgi:predicted CoA-binding protein